jgi:hypothetical protein
VIAWRERRRLCQTACDASQKRYLRASQRASSRHNGAISHPLLRYVKSADPDAVSEMNKILVAGKRMEPDRRQGSIVFLVRFW